MQAAGGASLSDAANNDAANGPAQTKGRRRVGVLLTVAFTALALDLITKMIAVEQLSAHAPIRVVDGVLTLRLVRNSGAAFGLAQGMTILFSAVAVVVVLVILRIARRLQSTAWAIAFGLVLGGSVGNLVDRIFREPGPFRGRVIDFLELPNWPVFNVADACIVSGGVLMVLLSLRGTQYDGQRAAG